jgi:hypothetical protein
VLERAFRATPAGTGPGIYRPHRPAATHLHRTVREHIETYIAPAGGGKDLASTVPFHVRHAFREYLRNGILAHGFARVYCAGGILASRAATGTTRGAWRAAGRSPSNGQPTSI